MFKVAVGQSEDPSPREAVAEIARQIKQSLGDIQPQAGILLCSLDFDHTSIISAIRHAYPGIELAGCTTDGESSSVCGFTGDSTVLMVFASDVAEIRAGVGKELKLRGKDAGRDAALAAKAGLNQCKGDERFAIMLSDPLNAGVSNISEGMAEVLGQNFPLIGAASAAHSKIRATHQFYNDEVLTDSVVLLLFAGPISFSWGMQGGHAPIGGKEKVTSSNKNVLYTIGDEPALNYFHRYIGENHGLFMNYCLAIFEEGRKGFYVRSAPYSDAETGSVTLNGVVSEGAYVQIGTADKNTCISSCANSIQMALEGYPGENPEAALFFSCAGRKMMMGSQVFQETDTMRKFLDGIPFCGFYAYGEFCPLEEGSPSLFHGTTFVTLLIGT
jgi:hypothetical protein